ncbi:hypothetical protein CKQ84_22045 [Shewanella sp. WE21]|nr:hypothetical protein CKQ84_22045 [Shewanella sp. WE21]
MQLAADGYTRDSILKSAEWWIDGAKCSENPEIQNGRGDIAIDGYYSKLHMQDTDTEKPVSTRTFSNNVDEEFN